MWAPNGIQNDRGDFTKSRGASNVKNMNYANPRVFIEKSSLLRLVPFVIQSVDFGDIITHFTMEISKVYAVYYARGFIVLCFVLVLLYYQSLGDCYDHLPLSFRFAARYCGNYLIVIAQLIVLCPCGGYHVEGAVSFQMACFSGFFYSADA